MTDFVAGALVAMVRDDKVVGARRIEKVYANGNFILARLPGSPNDRRPQYRGKETTAYQCGGTFRYGAYHLEAWTPDHARRLAEHKIEIDVANRTREIMSAIGQKCLTRESLAAMEVVLGIQVGAANE